MLGWMLVVPTIVLTVLGFGAVVRRLLGVPLGRVRTAVAAVPAFVVAQPLLRALLPATGPVDPGTALLTSGLAIGSAGVAAMSVLVVAEVVLPVGSLPGPVELWHSWRGRIARTRRYGQVVRIAWRHRLGRLLRSRPTGGPVDGTPSRRALGRSLRLALDEAGVAFVKLGQQLSTRGDLLPPEYVEEPAALQDSAAPVRWADVTAHLTAELGRRVAAILSPPRNGEPLRRRP